MMPLRPQAGHIRARAGAILTRHKRLWNLFAGSTQQSSQGKMVQVYTLCELPYKAPIEEGRVHAAEIVVLNGVERPDRNTSRLANLFNREASTYAGVFKLKSYGIHSDLWDKAA
jgi:hypothetical protein